MNSIRMLSIDEAAALIPGLSRFRVREMCIKGELPCVRAGKKYLINEAVLIQTLTNPRGVCYERKD